MNIWQALFSKRKNLSRRKRRKKPQALGWRGWTMIAVTVLVGAALAILLSEMTGGPDGDFQKEATQPDATPQGADLTPPAGQAEGPEQPGPGDRAEPPEELDK